MKLSKDLGRFYASAVPRRLGNPCVDFLLLALVNKSLISWKLLIESLDEAIFCTKNIVSMLV